MREFTINEIADEITRDLMLDIPKSVVRKLIRSHFTYLFKVIKGKKDRILMREADIHTIYTDMNLKELCGEIADLDETIVPKQRKGVAIKTNKFRDPKKSQKRWAKNIHKRKHLMPDMNA